MGEDGPGGRLLLLDGGDVIRPLEHFPVRWLDQIELLRHFQSRLGLLSRPGSVFILRSEFGDGYQQTEEICLERDLNYLFSSGKRTATI